jgi:hypothetical protein
MQVNEETPSFTSRSSAILIRISDTRRRIGSAVFAGRHDPTGRWNKESPGLAEAFKRSP